MLKFIKKSANKYSILDDKDGVVQYITEAELNLLLEFIEIDGLSLENGKLHYMQKEINNLDFHEIANQIAEFLPLKNYVFNVENNDFYVSFDDIFIVYYKYRQYLEFTFQNDEEIIYTYSSDNIEEFLKMIFLFSRNFQNRIRMEVSV